MKRLVAFILLLVAAPLAAQTFPELTGRVVDNANILTPEMRQQIEARSAAVEAQTTAQIVVATIPDLEGYPIEDYGYRLGRHWGIGQKGADNGVLLLVAPTERRVRIEVGRGLEPVLTDALSSVIIHRTILPKAREGNLGQGVTDGFALVAQQVELPSEQATANVKAAEAQAARSEEGGFDFGAVIVVIFLIFWFYMAFKRSKGGKTRRGRAGPVIIWGPGPGSWGGGGGGFGGGGFGGGGFGGGGGGFGGGGASGGW